MKTWSPGKSLAVNLEESSGNANANKRMIGLSETMNGFAARLR